MEIPQKNIIAYKLLDDGSILKISSEDLSSYFININIISIYFYKERRLYIWKGANTPRYLQNHIPLIEKQILELNPDFTILRHFTIEGAKEETGEFLDLLKINQEDFKKRLEEWDNFRIETLSTIETLQNEIKEHFAQEEFKEIQIKANEIIDLAEKIHENKIISEQELIIKEIIEKLNFAAEEGIKSQIEPLIEKFEIEENQNKFDGAINTIEKIEDIIKNSQDRGLQRYWANKKIKLKQKEEHYTVQQKQKQKELLLEENQQKYENLVQQIKGNELNKEWKDGYENCQKIVSILKKLEKFDEIKKYNQKSYFFEKAFEKEQTEKSQQIEQKSELKEDEEEAKRLKEEEEAKRLKEEEEAKRLKEEENKENKVGAEETFEEKLQLEDYSNLLRHANLIESQSPNETKEILRKCLTIIKENRETFIEKNPKRKKDEVILETRI
ncbi:MAG: hypothetical protein ACTSWX_08990 [Promethearchaeota archaeon]